VEEEEDRGVKRNLEHLEASGSMILNQNVQRYILG